MQNISGNYTLVKQCSWLAMNVQPVRFQVKSTVATPGIINLPSLDGVHGQLVLSFQVSSDTDFKTEVKPFGTEQIQGLSAGGSYFIQPNLVGQVIFKSNGLIWETVALQSTITAPIVIEGYINQTGTSAPELFLETALPVGFTITPQYNGTGDYSLVFPSETFITNKRHMLIQNTRTDNYIEVPYTPTVPANETTLKIKTYDMTNAAQDGVLMFAPFRLTIWPTI